MVRAAVCTPDRLALGWPDLTEAGVGAATWRPWLQQAMAAREFAAALQQASPVLADRVRVICDRQPMDDREIRRVVVSVLRYLLRASHRATPYGLFAGVAPAHIGAQTTVRVGEGHRAVVRVRAPWLASMVDRLEADPALLPNLTVRANDRLIFRSDEVVLEDRAHPTPRSAPTHVHVRATAAVCAALAAARHPVRLDDLASQLAADHRAAVGTVFALLVKMVSQRLLLTNLRPATTSTDPLSVVVSRLEQALASDDRHTTENTRAPARATLGTLRTLTGHHAASLSTSGQQRSVLAAALVALHPNDEPPVAVDLRLDVELRLPETVAVEAAQAAAVLVRLAPAGHAGWQAWHHRFLERYGPHALVPLCEVVDADVGLGYPSGYRGALPTAPAPVTQRDRKLLALAQKAALRRQHEVVLDDATIRDLAGEVSIAQAQPTTELTVTIHARSRHDLDRGLFRLQVVGVSRNAGTTTGRFLDLLDPVDRDRIVHQYAALPTTTSGALRAQVSAVTPYTVTEDVARAPQVIPHLISLGEYHDNTPGRMDLDDIAVTADVDRVYLVSISRRCPVEPIMFNAVEQVHYTLPLVRFLTEASTAFTTPCSAVDWGAASGLPFLPALRYRRTVLSPARWLLPAIDLPSPVASWPQWVGVLASWRNAVACPQRVYLGEGDQRIVLDLDELAHLAVLRDHLGRTDMAVLHAAPVADAAGWIDGRAHEVVIPLAATTDPVPPPQRLTTAPVVDVRAHGHLPGAGDRLYVKLYGHPDRHTTILTRHLPSLLERLSPDMRFWFLRYNDPDPHLRLRLTGGAYETTAIGAWARQLRHGGLIARMQVDTDYPEPARFGGPAAIATLEEVFDADSATALQQLAFAARKQTPDVRAVTAVSMLHITTALIGDVAEGRRWLIAHTRPHRPAPPRDIYNGTVRLADPDQSGLMSLPDGQELLAAWLRRDQVLRTYRDVLHTAQVTADSVLPDLLHLHHTRMIGPDPDSERACLHLARAAALSWTTRARGEHRCSV
ncbi:lantibiotic dehydratase [Micromonospora sp. NPDC049903]|uniref:lantibiotic dehydratase n=1 Tax=Micromonospora sp. NPDC049903 TaxID=3364276 RepID=UPI003793F6B4